LRISQDFRWCQDLKDTEAIAFNSGLFRTSGTNNIPTLPT
jgi:hypothetical protein